jgi:hypothetical protein
MNPKNILRIIAAVTLLTGTALSFQTARKIRETRLRVEIKLRDLEKLRAIENDARRGEAARQAVEKKPPRVVDPILPLVQSVFPGYKAEDCREMRRDLVPGWIVRQAELSFNDVPFADVMEFVRKTEAPPSPWRLAKCTLRATPSAPGTGQVVLQFEAVQRKE